MAANFRRKGVFQCAHILALQLPRELRVGERANCMAKNSFTRGGRESGRVPIYIIWYLIYTK